MTQYTIEVRHAGVTSVRQLGDKVELVFSTEAENPAEAVLKMLQDTDLVAYTEHQFEAFKIADIKPKPIRPWMLATTPRS